MSGDSYQTLIFKLGDLAYERLWGSPDAPPALDRVVKAAEVYEQRQVELKEIEASMDEEEDAYKEFCSACDGELVECRQLIQQFKRAVDAAESKAKSIESKLVSKRNEVELARMGVGRQEELVRRYEETHDAQKLETARMSLKKTRIEIMRRTRECEDLQAQYEQIMNPEDGVGAPGIRARYRELDLKAQLEERRNGYHELMKRLNDQAALKEHEIAAAREYYEQALSLLGEEVNRIRPDHPELAAFYPKLDKARK